MRLFCDTTDAYSGPWASFSRESHQSYLKYLLDMMAISSFLLALTLPFGVWIIYVLYCLAVNYSGLRKTDLPLVVLPIESSNPLWMRVDTRVLPFFRSLPFGFRNFTRFNWRGWEIQDRYRAHQELGDAFIQETIGYSSVTRRLWLIYLRARVHSADGDVGDAQRFWTKSRNN